MLESELTSLKRKDLQVLAKQHGLKANKKSYELIAELFLILGSETTVTEITPEQIIPSPVKEENKNTASAPSVVQPSLDEVAVGVIVHFTEAGKTQEGTVKRINKNSFRIQLINGSQVTIPKTAVLYNKPVEESKSVSSSPVEVVDTKEIAELVQVDSEPSSTSDQSPSPNEVHTESSDTKKKKKKKKSHGKKKKQSLPSTEITISPIKKKISTPTQQKESPGPEILTLPSNPPTEDVIPVALKEEDLKLEMKETVTKTETEVITKNENNAIDVHVLEEEKLMIDEEVNPLPKKKKKSSIKKKSSPKQKHVTISAEESVAPPSVTVTASVTSKNANLASTTTATPKKVRPPSIVPKTTAAMRARDNAISQKKKRLSELSSTMPKTPQGGLEKHVGIKKNIACVSASASKVSAARNVSRCTIDSSIMDKIKESSRRFSSSWSSQKPRKSMSKSIFEEKCGDDKSKLGNNDTTSEDVAIVAAVVTKAAQHVAPKPKTVSITTQPTASAKVTIKKKTTKEKETVSAATQSKSSGLSALNKLIAPTSSADADAGPHMPVKTNTNTNKKTNTSTSTKPHAAQAQSKRSVSVPVRSSSVTSTFRPTKEHANNRVRGVAYNTNTPQVTVRSTSAAPSRPVPTHSKKKFVALEGGVTSKPNPSHFLKRSSSTGPNRRPMTSKSIAKNTTNTTTNAVTAAASKIRPANTTGTGLENQNKNSNKPFKARPVPNFSKLHKHMFDVDKSVVNMVKENKQSTINEKMTKAVSQALNTPMTGNKNNITNTTTASASPLQL